MSSFFSWAKKQVGRRYRAALAEFQRKEARSLEFAQRQATLASDARAHALQIELVAQHRRELDQVAIDRAREVERLQQALGETTFAASAQVLKVQQQKMQAEHVLKLQLDEAVRRFVESETGIPVYKVFYRIASVHAK